MVSLFSFGRGLLVAIFLIGSIKADVYTCVIDHDTQSCDSLFGAPPTFLLCDTATPCDVTVNNQFVCAPQAFDKVYRVPVAGAAWTQAWQSVCIAASAALGGEVWGKTGVQLNCVSLGNCRGCIFDSQRNFHVCKDWVANPYNGYNSYSINCEFSLTPCDQPAPGEGAGDP